MLMPIQFASNCLLLLFLPFAMVALIAGKHPKDCRWSAKYFDAAPIMRGLSDKVFISICIGSVARDARLLGLVGESAKNLVTLGLGIPFCALTISFLVVSGIAAVKVHLI